jgi:hypothetical protein
LSAKFLASALRSLKRVDSPGAHVVYTKDPLFVGLGIAVHREGKPSIKIFRMLGQNILGLGITVLREG